MRYGTASSRPKSPAAEPGYPRPAQKNLKKSDEGPRKARRCASDGYRELKLREPHDQPDPTRDIGSPGIGTGDTGRDRRSDWLQPTMGQWTPNRGTLIRPTRRQSDPEINARAAALASSVTLSPASIRAISSSRASGSKADTSVRAEPVSALLRIMK